MANAELSFKFAETALVVLDLQPSVVAKKTVPNDPKLVVERAASLVKGFRSAGSTIVCITYEPDTSLPMPITDSPRKLTVVDQEQSQPVPELGIQKGDIRITKCGYDAFFGSQLQMLLFGRGIKTLVLCGISTESSVESTARTAMELRYNQIIVSDATSAATIEAYNGSQIFFNKWCLLRTTDQVLSAIKSSNDIKSKTKVKM